MKVWVELTGLSGRKLDIDVDYISFLSTDGKSVLVCLGTCDKVDIPVKESREEVKRLIKEAYRKAKEEE